jgi:plastocyanin
VIAANVAGPAGGNTYTGTGYLNSGILEAPGAFTVRFDAPPGRYDYLCLIHPFMTGTITVSG